MRPQRQIRFVNYAAYGSGDFLGAGAMAVISGWILFFYTTFAGLTAVQAAAIFAIARLLDAVFSPLIGYLSDNLYSTKIGRMFGRRRIFLLAAIPLLPSFAFMWVGGQGFLYYLATYVFFELVYASILIPYETLAAEMTPDYKKKAKFAGARILCGQVSAILAGVLPGRIIERFGRDSADTFLYLGIFFAILFMVVIGVVYLLTWERRPEEVPTNRGPQVSLFGAFRKLYSDLFSTLKVRAFRLHLGMYLGGYISQDIFNAAFTYFVIFAIGGTVVGASNLLGAMALSQLVAVACFIPLVLRLHPAPSYRIAVLLYGAAVIVFAGIYALQPAQAALWLFAPVLLAGLGRGGLNYIPWNTYNYMADVDQIVTGLRREGAFAGVMTFVRKTTQAAAVMGVGLVLEAGGFVSGQTAQDPGAINTIVLVMTVGTLVMLTFGFIVSLSFRLDRDSHELLMSEIERFRAGERKPSSERARQIIEDLTGWRYDRLWGANVVATAPSPTAPKSVDPGVGPD